MTCKIGVKSSAILFADMDQLLIGVMQADDAVRAAAGRAQHAFRPLVPRRGSPRRVLFVWQQWLIRQRDPAGCLRAFLNNQYVGLAIFVGILLQYVYG